AGLGIRLERRGAVLLPKDGGLRLEVKEGARAPYTLEFFNDTRIEYLEEENAERFRGTLRLLMHRGGKQRVLWEKTLDEETTASEGLRWSLSRLDVSPSGGRVVMLHRTVLDSTQGRYEKLWVEAVVDVPGDAPVKAE
ncbi:MAG TPA: hypothetical protein VGB96_14935, partial [Archangium sp.]